MDLLSKTILSQSVPSALHLASFVKAEAPGKDGISVDARHQKDLSLLINEYLNDPCADRRREGVALACALAERCTPIFLRQDSLVHALTEGMNSSEYLSLLPDGAEEWRKLGQLPSQVKNCHASSNGFNLILDRISYLQSNESLRTSEIHPAFEFLSFFEAGTLDRLWGETKTNAHSTFVNLVGSVLGVDLVRLSLQRLGSERLAAHLVRSFKGSDDDLRLMHDGLAEALTAFIGAQEEVAKLSDPLPAALEGPIGGVEIEMFNNERLEKRSPPTTDLAQLGARLMRIHESMSAASLILPKDFYWNMHLNLGVVHPGFSFSFALEPLAARLLYPNNPPARNEYLFSRTPSVNKDTVIDSIPGRREIGRFEHKGASISTIFAPDYWVTYLRFLDPLLRYGTRALIDRSVEEVRRIYLECQVEDIHIYQRQYCAPQVRRFFEKFESPSGYEREMQRQRILRERLHSYMKDYLPLLQSLAAKREHAVR